jgi:signal transduction histidine kinase
VDLTVDIGQPLPAGIELAVYRIVQEALTNVVKHAAPARCTVRVTADDDREVVVDVCDDGHRSRVRGAGHGLVGIRERVLMYGGMFAAGPDDERGFTVHATIPYQGSTEQ